MKITVLGTGTSQGVPVIACECPVCSSADPRDSRSRAALMVETNDGHTLVIDTGPDFRTQMLRHRVKQLSAVLFTHEHQDHVAGLDDVRPFYFKSNLQPVPIYAHTRVLKRLQQMFAYVFEESPYPGVPRLAVHTIENAPFYIGQNRIEPVEVMHHRLPVLGFRMGQFAYITDANYIAPQELDKLRGLDILIINALQHKPHISHFSLPEAIAVAQELKAQKTYFTHISHSLGLHAQIEPTLPPNIQLAYDGLELYC